MDIELPAARFSECRRVFKRRCLPIEGLVDDFSGKGQGLDRLAHPQAVRKRRDLP
jgi:hypothetical protein